MTVVRHASWRGAKVWVRDVALAVSASVAVPRALRWRMLRLLGLDLGPCKIAAGVVVGGTRVSIGPGVFINREVFIDASAKVTIGSGVSIGPRAVLLTSTHRVGRDHRRAGAKLGRPVTIGTGAWIGAGAVVMPGVSVGRGCIVGAGAVVTKDCAPNGVYVGAPARRLRTLEQDQPPS